MKKKFWMLMCMISMILCILSLYASFTITGSGFLDLSNLPKYVCYGASVFFGISALASLIFGKKSN